MLRLGGVPPSSDFFDGAVVVAMVAVGMMQVTIDQVVDVVAMRYGFVAAAWAVLVFVRLVMGIGALVGRRCHGGLL